MDIALPLISPLSRKYYIYAEQTDERIHHRAVDIRLCLEYVCDEIILQFISESSRSKWHKLKLHDKIMLSKEFMDSKLVDELISVKIVGNTGAHEGEEGDFSNQDIDASLDVIRKFSLEIFYAYFVKNGFGNPMNGSWVPTVFSTLPPIYRVNILNKYYLIEQSPFVIDKLSKAYLKANMKKEAVSFLEQCMNKNEINRNQFLVLKKDLDLLEKSFSILNIANDLDKAKENFNRLLPAIDENERDAFICLVSMVLNGESLSA